MISSIKYFVYYTAIVLLFSVKVLGQRGYSYCISKADSLLKSGIDTVIYYQPVLGNFFDEASDCCMIYDREYLLWKKNAQIYVLKHYDYFNMDNRTRGKLVQVTELIDSVGTFEFLETNFHSAVTEKLLPAVLKTIKGSEEIVQDYGKFPPSHPGYTQITIFTRRGTFRNGFSYSDVRDGTILNADGSFREKWESVNYESNIKKPIYILITKIKNQIAFLENSNVFK